MSSALSALAALISIVACLDVLVFEPKTTPSECDSGGHDPAHECLLVVKIARAMRGVTPALSACRRPLHRRLAESGKASCVTAAIARN